MPVYEYLCPHCDVRFEQYVRSFGEHVLCPRCAGEVEKQLSTFAMAGSGDRAPAFASGGGGGGCCGGGCGCRH